MTDNDSKLITFLRFPLAVFVVFIHTRSLFHVTPLSESNDDLLFVSLILKSLFLVIIKIADIAVPTFFLISGYLFFLNQKRFSIRLYINKLRSRFFTLFIPYICWIGLCFIIIPIYPAIKELLLNGNILDAVHTFGECRVGIVKSLWYGVVLEQGVSWLGQNRFMYCPLIIPMWFVRDLICVCILSPLLFLWITIFKRIGIAILCFCFVSKFFFQIPGFSIEAVFFFTLGGYFSINNYSLTVILGKVKIIACVLTLVLLFITIVTENEYVMPFFILACMCTFIFICSYIIQKFNVIIPDVLTNSCFVIFALHIAPFTGNSDTLLGLVGVVIKTIFKGYQDIDLLKFLLISIITIFICIIVNLMMRQNKFLSRMLTGARNH